MIIIEKDNKVSVKKTYDITLEQISTLLETAFEGGINYWCFSAKAYSPATKYKSAYTGFASDVFEYDPHNAYIQLSVDEMEYEQYTLTLENLLKGIEKYLSEHGLARNMEIDEVDAKGADMIIQYAIFNELVFG